MAHYIADSAVIVGDVRLDEESNVWHNSTIRGDMAPITIGRGSNVQDNSIIHVDDGFPTTIGAEVTIGHGCIIHGCTIGDGSLIGMGAIILNGAKIGKNCLIGAGALITQGMEIPDGSLAFGNPAKIRRELTEQEKLDGVGNAQHYVRAAKEQLKPVE